MLAALFIVSLIGFALACRFYGSFLAGRFGLDDANGVPSETSRTPQEG